MATVQLLNTLATEHCCACGMQFAMPLDYQNRRREDHKNFFCPSGHQQHYYAESPEEKLRKELAQERARKDQIEAQVRDLEAQNRRLEINAKRLKTRAANGVCPCCKRTFKELAKHMRSNHPEYAEAEVAK